MNPNPNIIEGVDISKSFTGEEIIEMHRRGKLRDVTLHGYCTRVDLEEGVIRFVPWWDSTLFRMEKQQLVRDHDAHFGETMMADVNANHPIRRRTPQQRVAAMMLRLMAEYRRTGTLPGVSPDLVRRVSGMAWREGTPLTDDAIRAVAAHFLGLGEAHNKEADSGFAIKDRTPQVGNALDKQGEIAAAAPVDRAERGSGKEDRDGDPPRGEVGHLAGIEEEGQGGQGLPEQVPE